MRTAAPATAPLADPPVLHTVAAGYGRMIAAGELSHGSAEIALARICIFHPEIGPDKMDAALSRALITVDRIAYADELEAAHEIRVGLRPLLARRAPIAVLKAESYRLSAARLLRQDCDAIVENEIAKRLQTSDLAGGRRVA